MLNKTRILTLKNYKNRNEVELWNIYHIILTYIQRHPKNPYAFTNSIFHGKVKAVSQDHLAFSLITRCRVFIAYRTGT